MPGATPPSGSVALGLLCLSPSLGHMSDYAFFFKRLSFFVFLTPISRQAPVPLIARQRYATVAQPVGRHRFDERNSSNFSCQTPVALTVWSWYFEPLSPTNS